MAMDCSWVFWLPWPMVEGEPLYTSVCVRPAGRLLMLEA